jgi:hypothetical protein
MSGFSFFSGFGYPYSDPNMIDQVWQMAQTVPGQDSSLWRKDCCGAWICRTAYGNRDNHYGWEIDHVLPKNRGGSDSIFNLQPLHWENNCRKGDGPLICAVMAQGIRNIRI